MYSYINFIDPSVGSGTGGAIDYTSLLNQIITDVQSVNGDTTSIELLLNTSNTLLAQLDGDDDEANLIAINSNLDDVKVLLQGLPTDTVSLENLITMMQTALVAEHNQSQVILSSILAELQSGINVNISNQIDLTALETTLTSVLTQATAINANTDTVENLLQTVITDITNLDSDDDAVALANIATQLGTVITELQDVDANTDTLEGLVGVAAGNILVEGDQTQVILTDILTKLNAGLDVNVTNQIDISGLQTTLTSILTQVTGINANTDTVESLLSTIITDLGNLDGDNDANGLALINTSLGNVVTELQAIDANTDTLEALITATTLATTTEGDQTQALLTTTNTLLTSIDGGLGSYPTAQEIADAVIAKERDVTPGLVTILNSGGIETLGLAVGTMGAIVAIEDVGTGLVRWTIDGSNPTTTNGATTTGPYHYYNLKNVDLGLVRLDGSSANSDYTIIYEIYN